MIDLALDLQLNVDGSSGDLVELAYDWLDGVSRRLAGPAREELEDLPARVAGSKGQFGPLGEPGSPFGVVSVMRYVDDRARSAERNCSAAGMSWLRAELEDLPTKADLWIGRLDERGHRSGRVLTLEVRHLAESSGWLRLHGYVDESSFTDPVVGLDTQRRWLEVMRSYADISNPGFGHISYNHNEGATALEDALPAAIYPRVERDPDYTVNDCRRFLRGYSWLTVVPAELAARLGGAAGLRSSGAFAEVHQLAAGGVWLLATSDYRDYDDEAIAKVFKVLAPVLRPGLPRDPVRRFPGQPPYRIVFADASTVIG